MRYVYKLWSSFHDRSLSAQAFRILLDIRELGREVYKNRAAAEKLAKKLGVQLPEQDSLLPPIAVSGKAADGDAS